MRVRTFLRQIRLSYVGTEALSIGDVAIVTGLAKGEISNIERGHLIPRDEQVMALIPVYGDPSGWYPATVGHALLPDLADCPGCGDELDPDASGSRRYHTDECRAAARRIGSRPQPVA